MHASASVMVKDDFVLLELDKKYWSLPVESLPDRLDMVPNKIEQK